MRSWILGMFKSIRNQLPNWKPSEPKFLALKPKYLKFRFGYRNQKFQGLLVWVQFGHFGCLGTRKPKNFYFLFFKNTHVGFGHLAWQAKNLGQFWEPPRLLVHLLSTWLLSLSHAQSFSALRLSLFSRICQSWLANKVCICFRLRSSSLCLRSNTHYLN